MESYLCNIRAVALRRILTKFQVSYHSLEIERGRRENYIDGRQTLHALQTESKTGA